MDPNAEERPPVAQIAEVDVDIQTEVRQWSTRRSRVDHQARIAPPSNPPLEPFMASSIFRRAFDDGSAQRKNVSRSAGISIPASEWAQDGHRDMLIIAVPEDAEAVQKQQEEEFQRRLRGEYEAAQVRVGSVVCIERPIYGR